MFHLMFDIFLNFPKFPAHYVKGVTRKSIYSQTSVIWPNVIYKSIIFFQNVPKNQSLSHVPWSWFDRVVLQFIPSLILGPIQVLFIIAWFDKVVL